MQSSLRTIGCMWVVSDHHNRLAEIAIERLKQVEDLVTGFPVEVTRRLVAQQQRRVCDDCPGNPDALLLASRQLPRVVLGSIREPDNLQRDGDALPALGFRQLRQEQGSSTFRSAVRTGSRL